MIKDPDETRDITWDWATKGTLGTDTITGATWTITPNDGSLTQTAGTHDDTTATVRIVGGTGGVRYKVTNRVTTARGQQFDWPLKIRVRDR